MKRKVGPLAGLNAVNSENKTEIKSWIELKRIVHRVHKHTCGHASYSDVRILLQRNNLWSQEVEHYLGDTMQKCIHCNKSASPTPARKVSLSSLTKSFNDLIFIDYFYLDDIRLFHVMDMATRFSACYLSDSHSMSDSIIALQSCWLSHHWTPAEIQADRAFDNQEFRKFCHNLGTNLRLSLPRRHNKNTLEPKHGIIRSIYQRLRSANAHIYPRLVDLQSVSISNDLYGNDTISSFEMAGGYTKPLNNKLPI